MIPENCPHVSKVQMFQWLVNLNKPPFPISPQTSLTEGKEPKAPAYYDGKYYKSLEWKKYQNWADFPEQLRQEIIAKWHKNPKIDGISTIGGWNGKHYLGWIDFDLKDFGDRQLIEEGREKEINKAAVKLNEYIEQWIKKYPILKESPHFTTPSGGHRFLVAWEKDPEGFKANSKFTLDTEFEGHMGELLTRNGGHTLLPPTVGTNGKPYEWVKFTGEYPPVVKSPELIGIYPFKVQPKHQNSPKQSVKTTSSSNKSTSWDKFLSDFQVPYSTPIPLFNCIAKNHRDLIDSGVGEGARDDTAAAIARDLIGTADYLNAINQLYEGTPEDLLQEFCDHCSPPLTDSDFTRIYEQAKKDNPTSCLSEDKIKSCIAGFAWNNGEKENFFQKEKIKPLSGHSKVVNHPKFAPITQDQVINSIDQLIHAGVIGSLLTAKLNELHQNSGIHILEIRKIYEERLSELEFEDNRSDTAKELESLLKIDNYSVNLARYLPEDFVYPLTYIADLLGSNPLSMLTVLLPTVATLINPDTKLKLIESTRFYSKPILYAGLVGESGSAKSPTMKTILDPFKRLQAEADSKYKQALEQYQEDFKAWKQEKKDERGEEPTKPNPREYFINDATSEAIAIIQDIQPNSGLLLELDELSGLVKSANAYRGGKGTDSEKILSGRDGTGIKVNRASGKRLSNPRSTLSIVGGIQPDTLRQQMGDLQDSQGYWARFIWASVPIKEAKFPDDEPQINASNLLYGLYKKILDYPATEYTLSDEARKLYGDWFRTLEKKKLDEPNQALRAVYSKFKGFTGDLALIINSIFNAWYGYDSPIVEADIMKTAIHLAKIYIGQVRLIYGEASIENGEISPILKKILDLSTRKIEITAKDVKSGIYALRKESPDKIRQLFTDLVQMGYGQLIGTGKKIRFTQKVDKVDEKLMKVDKGSTFLSTSQTQSGKGVQDSPNQKVDKVDEVDQFFGDSENSHQESTDDPIEDKKIDIVEEGSTFINCSQPTSETQSEEGFQKVDELSTEINQPSTLSTFSEVEQNNQLKVGSIIPSVFGQTLKNFRVEENQGGQVKLSHPDWDKPKYFSITSIPQRYLN